MTRLSLFTLALPAMLLLLVATDASAYRMWIEADRDVSTMAIGDTVSVDLHLDTQGESNILLMSVAVYYDPTVLSYDIDASSSNPYALYSPFQSKQQQARYLEPWGQEPYHWAGASGAPGYAQLNADFVSNGLLSLLLDSGTFAISDDELMSTMVFEKIAGGDVGFLLSGESSASVFSIGGEDIMDDVELGPPIGNASDEWLLGKNDLPGPGDDDDPNEEPGDDGDDTNEEPTGGGGGSNDGSGGGGWTGGDDGPVTAVPEPTAALLFGLGAMVFARRSARRDR